ncbi:hypothetical protein [Nibribacter koreensis]|uniref:Lipoprotein n=1 Tax=Nibribacter koreensis TaxID=1084519 RepID=A0ABP8FH95_9BACT
MNRLIIYFSLALIVSSCTSVKPVLQPTYNKGGYTFQKYHSKSLATEESVVIVGSITDLVKNNNLGSSSIKYECTTQQSSSGEFSLKGKASAIKFQLIANSVGYLKVETEPFHTQPGDSIVVNFRLAQDEKPILYCEANPTGK